MDNKMDVQRALKTIKDQATSTRDILNGHRKVIADAASEGPLNNLSYKLRQYTEEIHKNVALLECMDAGVEILEYEGVTDEERKTELTRQIKRLQNRVNRMSALNGLRMDGGGLCELAEMKGMTLALPVLRDALEKMG